MSTAPLIAVLDVGKTNSKLFVFGREDRFMLISRLDNLGKGASGAAVQSMNLHLGVDEGLGLES